MAKNLRSFVQELRQIGQEQLEEVSQPVAARLGVPAYLEGLEKRGLFPAVLFTQVIRDDGQRSPFPVLSNLFASRFRLARSIGVDTAALAQELALRTRPVPPCFVERSRAPVKDVVLLGADVDVGMLPVVTHHAGDGGAYITGASVWCRDIDTGAYNCAMLRLQVKGPRKLGIHLNPAGHTFFHYRRWAAAGKPMPVAICIGHHPAFYLGTQAKVVGNEIEYIGGVLGEPLVYRLTLF